MTTFAARKCDATNRLITPKDHASIQLNVANVDENGVITSDYQTFTISGYVRKNDESDDSINRLATEAGLLKNVWSARK